MIDKQCGLLIILLLLFSHTAVFAEEKTETSGYASLDVMSNYVWRGQKLSNSWVLQPSVGINYKGLGFNIWANYDNDRDSSETSHHREFTETDFSMNYTFSMEKLNFEGGYTYPLSNDAEEAIKIFSDDDDKEVFYGGLNLKLDF